MEAIMQARSEAALEVLRKSEFSHAWMYASGDETEAIYVVLPEEYSDLRADQAARELTTRLGLKVWVAPLKPGLVVTFLY